MKITVTEENFESILSRLQSVCSKYIMLRSYRVYDSDMKEEKEYRSGMLRILRDVKISKSNKMKIILKISLNKSFIDVSKHRLREKYENNDLDKFDTKFYNETQPFIFIDLGYGCAMTISIGDKIRFYPFGGFSIYTDNEYLRFDGPLVIYKNTFFPCKKIKDLEEEKLKRMKEWEEAMSIYDPLDYPDIYDSLSKYESDEYDNID